MGGFRGNPDPQQFRAPFRHVIVDKLLVPSKSGNCKTDADKILSDISNVTILQKQAKDVSVPQSLPSTELTAMVIPAPSIPKQNVVSYMAGYLIRKYTQAWIFLAHLFQVFTYIEEIFFIKNL